MFRCLVVHVMMGTVHLRNAYQWWQEQGIHFMLHSFETGDDGRWRLQHGRAHQTTGGEPRPSGSDEDRYVYLTQDTHNNQNMYIHVQRNCRPQGICAWIAGVRSLASCAINGLQNHFKSYTVRASTRANWVSSFLATRHNIRIFIVPLHKVKCFETATD